MTDITEKPAKAPKAAKPKPKAAKADKPLGQRESWPTPRLALCPPRRTFPPRPTCAF